MRGWLFSAAGSCLLVCAILGMVRRTVLGSVVPETEAAQIFGGDCVNFKVVDGCGDMGMCDVHNSYTQSNTGTANGDSITNTNPCLGGDCGQYESINACVQG
jgi:hypothetical protein